MDYPTPEQVEQADLRTLIEWDENLLRPSTPQEWAVRCVIVERLEQQMREVLRREAPHLVDKMNEIIDHMERLGIRVSIRHF